MGRGEGTCKARRADSEGDVLGEAHPGLEEGALSPIHPHDLEGLGTCAVIKLLSGAREGAPAQIDFYALGLLGLEMVTYGDNSQFLTKNSYYAFKSGDDMLPPSITHKVALMLLCHP